MDQSDLSKTIAEVVEAFQFLHHTWGEPAAGGEQAFSRSHLYEMAQRIKAVRVDLTEEQHVLDLTLQIAQMTLLDLSGYRPVALAVIRHLLNRLEPFVHPRPSPVVIADPGPAPARAFALHAPEPAVETLADLLKITVTDLTQALITLERQGYVLTKKVG